MLWLWNKYYEENPGVEAAVGTMRRGLAMSDFWRELYPDHPMEWRYPPDLTAPASSPVSNLAIMILARDIVGNDVVEALGLYLAADAQFNLWYGKGAGGGNRAPSEMARIRESSEENLRRVYEAWRRLDECFDSGDRESFEELHFAFLSQLRIAVGETRLHMDETPEGSEEVQ
jgi:hypothetical protein